jgi:hypothetical protein
MLPHPILPPAYCRKRRKSVRSLSEQCSAVLSIIHQGLARGAPSPTCAPQSSDQDGHAVDADEVVDCNAV